MNTNITPYVFFGGRCQEALDFYTKAIGAEVGMKMLFSDSPDPVPEGMLTPGFESKIMHSEFKVGQTTVLASDGCSPDDGRLSGFSLALSCDDQAHIEQMFAALSQGGTVVMPLMETFWSPCYGMLTDKFGVSWMLMVPGQAPQ